MRLDDKEKRALKYSLAGFNGDVYLFGSRLDDAQKGGDIDLLLVSKDNVKPLNLSLKVQTKFFLMCEQEIDVVVYNENIFCEEIIKHAKRLDITRI